VKARLSPGQDLIIPRAPAALLAARAQRPAPSEVASRSLASSATAPSPSKPSSDLTQITYKVKRGDTLFSIAQLFDTTVAKIKSWNSLRGNTIAPGARLKILASRTN
jgi:membrane-bound lytic murein transglycosylase D